MNQVNTDTDRHPENEVLPSFEELTGDFANLPEVRKMESFIQHGTTTTYEHCEGVARMSLYLSRKFHVNSDEKALVRAAFLHDFYLYDWHGDDHKPLHGFHHPETARKNARQYFNISRKEEKIIASHMWPLTLTHLPTSREAVIVCIADKICAIREVFAKKAKGNS